MLENVFYFLFYLLSLGADRGTSVDASEIIPAKGLAG